MALEAFFYPAQAETRLFGVARGTAQAKMAWVIVPPFGEEEKSARRTLTEIARALEGRGQASLLFSYRGTGDSEGDFADFALSDWREDIAASVAEARRRYPQAQIGLLGVRLGAALSLEVAAQNSAAKLVLIEPLLSGRSFLSQQNARKKLRAGLTGEAAPAGEAAPTTPPPAPAGDVEDLDGWALSTRLKTELSALDLRAASDFKAPSTLVLGVSPRTELATPMVQLADKLGASKRAVVMPPFWNLLDYSDSSALIAAILEEVGG